MPRTTLCHSVSVDGHGCLSAEVLGFTGVMVRLDSENMSLIRAEMRSESVYQLPNVGGNGDKPFVNGKVLFYKLFDQRCSRHEDLL